MLESFLAKNTDTIWLITDKCNLYQLRLYELEETKASNLGLYLANYLEFEKDENILRAIDPSSGFKMMINVFENGKIAKIDMDAYKTKGYRKKLQNAYSNKSKLINTFAITEDRELVLITDRDTYLRFNTELINMVSSRSSQGVQVARLPRNTKLKEVIFETIDNEKFEEVTRKIPKTPKKQITRQLEL